jgi:hypothetical protein
MRLDAPLTAVICGIVTLICTMAQLTGLKQIGADVVRQNDVIA